MLVSRSANHRLLTARAQGTYFVFRTGSTLKAYKITPTTPPTIVFAWSVSQTGSGSPWVTTTDGTNNAIVWVVGAQGDQRLHGYNGDTGAVVYAGGGANELMTGTRKWNSGIAARGSIYVANDNKVYAFRIPCGGTPTPTPTATLLLPHYCAVTPHSYRHATTLVHTDCDSNCDANRNPDGTLQLLRHGHVRHCDDYYSVTPNSPREAPCASDRFRASCNSTVFTQLTDFYVYITGCVNSLPPPSVFTVNGIPADSVTVVEGRQSSTSMPRL